MSRPNPVEATGANDPGLRPGIASLEVAPEAASTGHSSLKRIAPWEHDLSDNEVPAILAAWPLLQVKVLLRRGAASALRSRVRVLLREKLDRLRSDPPDSDLSLHVRVAGNV